MLPALNILVLNHLAERHITAITSVMPGINVYTSDLAHAAEFLPETDILVPWGWMNISELYPSAPKLKWVHALSAGVENIIATSIQNSDIIVTNSKGIHGIPVSEHVLALMLTFTRGLNHFIRLQTAKSWKRVPTDEIHEKTLAIIGLGSIGREIAKKAKGLGMHVLATKREMTAEIFVDKLYKPDKLGDMLAIADFVVVALPLIEETKEYIRLEHFEAMKRTAYFINIARGTVVREADLITALESELIQGAGLDVFAEEPLPENNPLWDMPNVIITPHVAALSPYYLDRAVKLFVDNLARFCQGGEMFNIVDKVKGY